MPWRLSKCAKVVTWLVLVTGLGLCVQQDAQCQNIDTPTLTVEAREVLVPVTATEMGPTQAGQSFDYRGQPAGWLKGSLGQILVPGLAIGDFDAFEDDRRIAVSHVEARPYPKWEVRDHLSAHFQGSTLTNGIWDFGDSRDISYINDGPLFGVYYVYVVPYPFSSSKCHTLRIVVNRPAVKVRSRTEFCDESSLTDPLRGSRLGQRLEKEVESARPGRIWLAAQAGVVLVAKNFQLVDLSLQFLPSITAVDSHHDTLYVDLGILGVIRGSDDFIQRFSDPGLNAPRYTVGDSPMIGPYPDPDNNAIFHAQRYEKQVRLPAGEYHVKLALTNGMDSGSVDVPVSVPKFDPSMPQMSSVFLCKRFHKPEDAPGETLGRPPEYQPLMSQGIEFTPAGDTTFRKGDQLMLWFQIAPPDDTAETEDAHFRIKIWNQQAAKLEVDSGAMDATPYWNQDKKMYEIAKAIDFERLAPGEYRVDVETTNPGWKAGADRSANFTVAKR